MKRLICYSFIGLGVMLAALLLASPVQAQDLAPEPGTAPVSDPAAVETPSGEAPAEPAPVEPVETPPPEDLAEPAPADAAQVDGESVLAEEAAPPVAEAPAGEPPAEVLAEAGVVVTNGSGEALPLAGEAASAGDPYFTVGATTYHFYKAAGACGGAPNCWDGLAAPISAAIETVASGLIPNDRKIYVEADTYNENVTIDATAPGKALLAQLMGLIGGVDAISKDPDRILNGDILVKGSSMGFTLDGFLVNGNVDINTISGSVTVKNLIAHGNSPGIPTVFVGNTSGLVTVEHVDASSNNGSGLVVDNSFTYGPVSISNGHFDRNDDPTDVTNYFGVVALSKGAITVNGVSASHNGGSGAYLQSTTSTVTVLNSAMNFNMPGNLNEYYGYGLWAESSLLTRVDNLVASDNYRSGLRATSGNSVTLSNIIANTNSLDGISVARPVAEPFPDTDWTLSGGTVVTMTNIQAGDNFRHGVLVRSTNAISITNIDTFNNEQAGADLDNCLYDGTACLGVGNISLTNGTLHGHPNPALQTQDYGLKASSRGSILLTNVHASCNQLNGAFLRNDFTGAYGLVSIQGLPSYQSQFNTNNQGGLVVMSRQGIILGYVDANDNGWQGASLSTNYAGTAGLITVGQSNFYNNQYHGLEAIGRGAISLYQVAAGSNGQSGLGDGAILDNLNASYPMPVTITWGQFHENLNGSGLIISSKGYISLYGVSAWNNALDGAYLYNGSGTAAGVMVYGATNSPQNPWSDFYDNDGSGLSITSSGAVVVYNANLSENTYYGLYIHTGTSAYGSAILANVFMDNNGYNGLSVTTYGPVALTNGRTNNNGYNGGYSGTQIYNHNSAYAMPVTITGLESCNNAIQGLLVNSKGAITLGNAHIETNTGSGATLTNLDGIASMVYVYNSDLGNNNDRGLTVTSRGYILLSSVWASNNQGGGGISLENATSAYGVGITYTRGSTSNNQGSHGLVVVSKGAIFLSDVHSSNNPDGFGAYVDNHLGAAAGVTFIGGGWGNSFSRNGEHGMSILSSGAVTLYNLGASENGEDGLIISTSGPVYIAGTLPNWVNDYNGNQNWGIQVSTWSSITLYNVEASQNLEGGASLVNSGATYNMPVSVTLGQFNENQNYNGLRIESRGTVSLTAVDAERNSVDWHGQATVGETYRDHLPGWDADGDSWWFELTSAMTVTIAMDEITGDMDPYLELFDSNGNLLLSDDNGGGGLNASITTGVLGTGWYRIAAMQNTPREDSEYLLAINDPAKELDRGAAVNVSINNDGWNGATYTGLGPVIINGAYNNYSSFHHAAGSGVLVSTNGGLWMNYVDSSNNGMLGVGLTDHSSASSLWTYIRCNDNPASGASVSSSGTVFYLYRGEFLNNGERGLYLEAQSGTGVNFTTLTLVTANSNAYDGLWLFTRGPVTLTNIETYSNEGHGTYVSNEAGGTSGYIYVLGSFNAFSDNGSTGFAGGSKGAILLTNTNADNNHLGGGVTLSNSGGGTGAGITVQGFYPYLGWFSSFSNNFQTGLTAHSDGPISLYNVRAIDNGGSGAYLDNSYASVYTSPIIVTSSQFNGNKGGYGLDARSRGAISLTFVRADNNFGSGAALENYITTGTIKYDVTVINSDFNGSQNGPGLYVHSKGNILGYTIRAQFNDEEGAHLDNRVTGSTGIVSLYGFYGENIFTGNGDVGLYINSYGAVTIYHTAATQNQVYGAYIYTDKPVTVSLSRFTSNVDRGLRISTAAPVTLSYLSAICNGTMGNDADGILVSSNGGNVSLTYSTVTGNFGHGIEAELGAGTFTQSMNNYLGNDRDMDQFPDSQDNILYYP